VSDGQHQLGIERGKDPAKSPEWHRLDPASFEQGDLVLAKTGTMT
jgi:hypothetical protein